MRNFQCLAANVDTIPLLNAIMRQPDLWNQNTLRTDHPNTAHAAVDDIWLRFNKIEEDVPEKVVDDIECINYPAWWRLPQAQALVFDLMRRVGGERLGRVLATRLAPGCKITPHIDGGAPAWYYERFHIVLNSAPGCLFRSGDEMVSMQTGQVWWFDNTKEHEVINNSADDRIHLIVDIRTSE
jgi:hypothetical protein